MKFIFRYDKNNLKINYFLNIIRLLSAALVYLITTPYINRILGVYYVGKVEYVNTIINYFLLFSALGIPMYAIREIAKCKNDEKKRAKVVLEMLIILAITTIVSYILLFLLIFNLGFFTDYRPLLVIMSIMVLLTNIGCEWYFQGIEEHLYITIRQLTVRLVGVFLVYFCIEQKSDYEFYAWFLVIIACGANFLNFYLVLKLLFKNNISSLIKSVQIKHHIKPILTIFVATISVNIYLQLDYLLLGILTSDKYVGYYSVANKLIRFVISFITIIGVVSLPRLTHYFHTSKSDYFILIKKIFNYLIIISLPISIMFFTYAEFLIDCIGGKDFSEAILTMKILSPLCIVVSIAYILGFLVLYPQNKEKVYTYAVLISAILSLLFNYYAILNFQQNGAAVIGVLAEIIAVVIMFCYISKNKLIPKLLDFNLFKVVLCGVVMLIFSNLLLHFVNNFWFTLLLIVVSYVVYAALLFISKEKEVRELYNVLKNKMS